MTLCYSYDQKLGNIDVFRNIKVKEKQEKVCIERGRYTLWIQINVCKEFILACKLSAKV